MRENMYCARISTFTVDHLKGVFRDNSVDPDDVSSGEDPSWGAGGGGRGEGGGGALWESDIRYAKPILP